MIDKILEVIYSYQVTSKNSFAFARIKCRFPYKFWAVCSIKKDVTQLHPVLIDFV